MADNRVIVRLSICGDFTGWSELPAATSFSVMLPENLARWRLHRLIVGEVAKAISDYMADECLTALGIEPPKPQKPTSELTTLQIVKGTNT